MSVVDITGRGTVATGRIQSGDIKINDKVEINTSAGTVNSVVTMISTLTSLEKIEDETQDESILSRETQVDEAKEGDCVAVLLRGMTKKSIKSGDQIRVLVEDRE